MRLALVTSLALAAGLAAAAEPPQAEAPAPAPAGFESTLATYRPYRADEPLEDWREANAAVGQAGGHAGHGKAAPETGRMSEAGQMHRHHGEHGR